MSNLIKHAEAEFARLNWCDEDKMQNLMCDNIIELLETFSKQGHSGSSAPYALELFNKLARFEPITPLTGEDDEWVNVDNRLYQNKRDSRVFKDDTGAYFSQGKVFREPNGSCYTNKDSHVYIDKFPYTPKTEYVDVEA